MPQAEHLMRYTEKRIGKSFYDFYPRSVKFQRIQYGFLGKRRRTFYLEFQSIVRNNRMNGELRTVRLPSEANPTCLCVLSDKIAVFVHFPNVITRPVSMIFFLKQTIRKQVIATDKDGCTYRIIMVLRDIDALVPNTQDSPSCFLNVFMRVGNAVRIIRRTTPADEPDVPATKRISVLHRLH